MKDYYKILGVEKSDSMITIKRVFRKLALRLHPDVNKSTDAHEKFIELNEAFQVLGNPIKRKRYDQLYHVKILKKEPRKKDVYNRKREFWEKSVENSIKKGNIKGQKNAVETKKKYQSKTFFGDSSILSDIVFEILWEGISLVFNSITE